MISNKKFIYCIDKRYVCPLCYNDIDKDKQLHCNKNISPQWEGCYCCDDLKCCKDGCTCNGQKGVTDDTYGYLIRRKIT